jgi:hypothetical protein
MYRKNSILGSARKNPSPVDKNRGLETTLLILVYRSDGKIDAHQSYAMVSTCSGEVLGRLHRLVMCSCILMLH